MLVLTRHVHQSIVIGHDVIVTVLEVRGDQVRLGITAPKDIQVHREEVFAALTAANRQAATSASELEVLKELGAEPIASSQGPPRTKGPVRATVLLAPSRPRVRHPAHRRAHLAAVHRPPARVPPAQAQRPRRTSPSKRLCELVHQGFTYGAGPISFVFGATLVYRRRRWSNVAGALVYGSAWWTLGNG